MRILLAITTSLLCGLPAVAQLTFPLPKPGEVLDSFDVADEPQQSTDETLKRVLWPGDYLIVPPDGSGVVALRVIHQPLEGNKHRVTLVWLDPSQVKLPQHLKASTPPPTTSASSVDERVRQYNAWRNSWRGRMYATSMQLKGFVPIFDPKTGMEKWVPKNSLGIIQY